MIYNNTITGTQHDYAMDIAADSVTILDNNIFWPLELGIVVAGQTATITHNMIQHGIDLAKGIHVRNVTGAVLVRDNTVYTSAPLLKNTGLIYCIVDTRYQTTRIDDLR